MSDCKLLNLPKQKKKELYVNWSFPIGIVNIEFFNDFIFPDYHTERVCSFAHALHVLDFTICIYIVSACVFLLLSKGFLNNDRISP